METTNLLELARSRRLAALASLTKREDNLFDIADHRLRKNRRSHMTAIFRSGRTNQEDSNLRIFKLAA